MTAQILGGNVFEEILRRVPFDEWPRINLATVDADGDIRVAEQVSGRARSDLLRRIFPRVTPDSGRPCSTSMTTVVPVGPLSAEPSLTVKPSIRARSPRDLDAGERTM